MLANVNRDSKARPKPYKAEDFIHWRDTGSGETVEPVLLENAEDQSNLMRAALFGKAPE